MMKHRLFSLRKWTLRALLAAGAVLGLGACRTTHRANPAEAVYGPPPGYLQRKVMPNGELEPVVVDPAGKPAAEPGVKK